MDRLLDFSDGFVISSGTVPIDIPKGLVLLLYYRPKGEYMLPKGRKNFGETLEAAAIRETTEESGFECHLFKHQLPTNAQQLGDSQHTEPIAVQQRMNQGVRKIIFWYISEVDSCGRQMPDTQEEGEEFDVEWVRMEDAPSRCSFVDDRRIVEMALEAVPRSPEALSLPLPELRDAYLDASVDRQALGFLSISLGGSIVKQQTGTTLYKVEHNTDWDGCGILETKESIVRLIRDFRAELCAMLRIEKEECPSMKVPENLALWKQWEILRFSGWTAEGSKRTIKIWSKESLERVVSASTSSHLGLLSHKVRRFTECFDPEHGPRLHIYQPIRATGDLHILRDFDFLQRTALESLTSSNTEKPMTFSPGVSCDLLLTSLCLLEREPGFTATVKATILRKWQLLSGAPASLSIIPLFYHFDAISSAYKSKLQAEVVEMNLKASDAGSSYTSSPIRTRRAAENTKGYRDMILIPLYSQKFTASARDDLLWPAKPSYAKANMIRADPTELSRTFFSSNSKGRYADIMRATDQTWQQVYIKNSISALLEVEVLSRVRQHFPLETVQTVLAVDEDGRGLFFKRFKGEILNELRLRYHHRQSPVHGHLEELHYRSDEWFIDLDLRRANDVLVAYQKTFRDKMSSVNCSGQKIHNLYHKRLQNDRRIQEFYDTCSPSFLEGALDGDVSLENFLNIPISINGQSHGTLRHHLDRATQILDPERSAGLQSLPCAFGFGDGHGGNVMVSLDSDPPSLLYIDYEVTGYHTPFLDLAKPMYLDGFFNVMYADLLYDSLLRKDENGGIWVEWTIEKDRISIDYGLALEPLWKAMAAIKLEYILRPILEMLEQLAPFQRDTAEETLASGLFCCALLSRNYSTRPDVFYLNLALGVRLATEMRDVFFESFGWSNWPQSVMLNEELLPRGAPEADKQQLIPFNGKRDDLHVSKTQPIPDTAYGSFSKESEILMAGLLSDTMEEHTRGIPLCWKIYKSLDFETVFLKREEETLALHNRFSNKAGEVAAVISQRIDHVRKEAMRVAPFTCITECLFAESRIDQHFQYLQILAEIVNTSKKTLIDVGCCMGTDIRTLIAHGYPAHNITGLDREIRFIKLGYTLYNHRPQDLGVRFRGADVLDSGFFKNCKDLAGQFDFVHSANVIHLFDEAQQEAFIQALAFLVRPGGTVWGRQVSLEDSDDDEEAANRFRQPEGKGMRFTIAQFRRLWLRATGWDAKMLEFEAELVPYDELRDQRVDKRFVLQWSIRAPMDDQTGRILDGD